MVERKKTYIVQVSNPDGWHPSRVSIVTPPDKPVTKAEAIKWAQSLDSRTGHYRAVCETTETKVIWEARKKGH